MRILHCLLFITIWASVCNIIVADRHVVHVGRHHSKLGIVKSEVGLNPELLNARGTPTPTPTKQAPSTAAPSTAAPSTAAPSTAAPSTAAPSTAAPSTAAPSTAAPSTAAPSTAAPSTAAPTTAAPTTAEPTTVEPTTAKPTPPHCTTGDRKPVSGSCRNYTECDKTYKWVEKTCSTWCHNFNPTAKKCDWNWKYNCTDPSTVSPCTSNPTTAIPTTEAPTTAAPTTAAPTTAAPTTAAPTTVATTTAAPTTAAPTTAAPTTTKQTTAAPTTSVPECTTQGQKKIYKKGDCKDYWECDSSKWVKKSCSFGYDFDINKLSCTWSWWAKC